MSQRGSQKVSPRSFVDRRLVVCGADIMVFDGKLGDNSTPVDDPWTLGLAMAQWQVHHLLKWVIVNGHTIKDGVDRGYEESLICTDVEVGHTTGRETGPTL